jgi:hypothetical protein
LAITPLYTDSQLKAYYRFSTGALTTDSSGEAHTLTAISDPAEDSSGVFNGAVALDGNDAYSAVDHADFKPTGAFTISAWIKSSTTGALQIIFQSYSQNTNRAGFFFEINTVNQLTFIISDNTGTSINTSYMQIIGGTVVTDGNWHLAVGTWNGTTLNLYVDGVVDATPVSWAGHTIAYAATNYVHVGCKNSAGSTGSYFTGSLDDVALFNGVALTPTQVYSLYSSTDIGSVRLVDSYVDINAGTNLLLSLTDNGYVTRKSGVSSIIISGASCASGASANSVQLGGNTYIATSTNPLIKFNGTILSSPPTLPSPSSVAVTKLSGATGTVTYGWRISAMEVGGGETLGSTAISLSGLPLDLTESAERVTWAAVSAASGVLSGYSVYRGILGDETFVATVGNTVLTYDDVGSPQSDTIFPPNANQTGGINAKYILRFDDRVVLAGISGDPTLLMISARYPYQDRFNWADGGGYIRINPDGGDEITGLGIAGSQAQGGTIPASILVFMKNITHQVVLKNVTLGNYLVLDPQAQALAPTGCSSHKTIVQVDNNIFYFGRQGLFTIGTEASFLNQLRTREISARIRTYIQGLSEADFNSACATYINYKYLLSFPLKRETIVYDFERACFMGPWKTPWGITCWYKYFDGDGKEVWVAGTDTGIIKEFTSSLTSDSGIPIAKLLKTKKEDFGNWSVMKIIKTLYVLFRNVKGTVSVNVRIEDRSGSTVSIVKSFDITGSLGNSGWGTELWGGRPWGNTISTVLLSSEEIIRWTQLFKTARTLQIEVTSTGATDNWEFLGIRSNAQPMSEGSLAGSTRV